jgi:hypothetical protein
MRERMPAHSIAHMVESDIMSRSLVHVGILVEGSYKHE